MTTAFDFEGRRVELFNRTQFELEGLSAELPPDFPPHQRCVWPAYREQEDWRLLRVSAPSGQCVHIGLRINRLRALPGGLYVRVPKFGVGLTSVGVELALAGLAALVRKWWRVIRLRLELTQYAGPDHLERVAQYAAVFGFRRTAPLEYRHTLLVPLSVSQEILTKPFSRAVLKNARKTATSGHVVAPISGVAYVHRMQQLYQETFSRTGAPVPSLNLRAILDSAQSHPNLFHLVGLFANGSLEPSQLLAYRWCGSSGEYAYDLLAASTRMPQGAGTVPMMPSIMLNMFDWAAGQGAHTFDFGGVVLPDDERFGAVGTISRFKHQFGGQTMEVGSDLILEPRPKLALAATAARAIAQSLRR